MFCPKCGTKNPDDAKFCRKCGEDLEIVSLAVAGELAGVNEMDPYGSKRKKPTWESAMSKLFMGLAFLAVSIVLGVTGAAGGSQWWFWMLIPAFAMLGTGVADVIRLREQGGEARIAARSGKDLGVAQERALPEPETEFVSPVAPESYQTGELVPPSVVENTTRHLETDSEMETMTLPKEPGK